MDLKDYDSGRICEALGWLCGGEWAFDGEVLYTSASGDWMDFDEDHTAELHRDCWLRVCGDDLAHALEVTAPWEWVCHGAKLPGDDGKAYTQELDHGVWEFGVLCCDGPTIFNNPYDTEAAAKSAARAAYLRWMRGGLER
jgi:hypothetical protein